MGSQFVLQIYQRISLCATHYTHYCLHLQHPGIACVLHKSPRKHFVSEVAQCRLSVTHCVKRFDNKSLITNITTAVVTLVAQLNSSHLCRKMSSCQHLEAANVLDDKEDKNTMDCLITSSQTTQPEQSKSETEAQPLSKKAMKRLARAEKHKEYKRRKREASLQAINRDDVGYKLEDLDQSSYYFENGLRKVYPYQYVFATHAKGRWVGCKLWDVLEQEFGYDHPDDLMKAFKSGLIHVNNKIVALSYVIRHNDYICHRIHRHENPVTAAPIEIIDNTDDMLVINKPSSIPCHPCGRYRFNSVAFILGKEMGFVNLRGVHRLDRLTSGVLILCKTPGKTKTLMDQVGNRQVQKEYVCRVVGRFPDGTVEVNQPLQALSNKLRLQVVSPTGKPSQTTFSRISYNGRTSVVRCLPHTGRTHQIRVHLQYLGHPILNDGFYNSDVWGPSRGKNGLYELPFDQVCERMLAEHHKQLWVGSDNPLYEVKLKEAMLTGSKNGINDDDKQATDVVSAPEERQHLLGSNCSSATDNKLQTDSRQTQMQTDGQDQPFSCHGVDVVSQQSSNDSHSSACSLFNGVSDPCQPEAAGLDRTADSQLASSCPTDGSPSKELPTVSSSTSAGERKAQLPGFEMSKWVIDPACDRCKTSLIDPEAKHLVMFLHAIRYKGPDWEYQTSLPDWASDDWNREEEFMLTGPDCL